MKPCHLTVTKESTVALLEASAESEPESAVSQER